MMETKEQKNESRTKEKKPLTEQQRQQRQKMLVYPLMVLLFAGCMWLIFAPSSEDKEKERQGQGFNTDMPMPEDSKIIGDKAKAYEQQDLENKRKERRGMVGDLSAFWNDSDGDTPTDDADTSDDYRLTRTETTDGETADERQAGIRTSAAAYQRLNTSLGTFYEPPKEDTEKEELRERIDELEAMLVAQDSRCLLLDEPTSALDIAHQVDVLALVHRLSQERGLTVIAVLHDINMAARYCDYLVALRGGEMIAQGTPAEIMRGETLEMIYGIPMGILPHPAGAAPVSFVY